MLRRVEGLTSRLLRNRSLLLSSSLSSSSSSPYQSQTHLSHLCTYVTTTLPSARIPVSSTNSISQFRSGPLLPFFASSSSFATAAGAARKIPSSEYMPKELVLYQYAACPFCNKVRAFLDYHDLPYKLVEVNPISKKEIKWSNYKKVPILVLDGEQLTDSSEIISIIDRQINPTKEYSSVTTKMEEHKWCRWVDEQLVHVLAPNIYRSPSEALESFDYITTTGNFTTLERWTGKYVGAVAMYFISKKLKKRHNITNERGALYDAVDTWIRGLDSRSFMGGSRPNLADLAVFGVLRPTRHLQSGRDMMANTAIGPWYNRMESAVGERSQIGD